MKNQILNYAKGILKITAAAAFGLCSAVSSFAQEPVHAIHHPVEVLTSTERGNGDTRPAPELDVTILENPSATGIFTVQTVTEDVLIEVYTDRMDPNRAEIENVRPGQYVIDMSKKDNGIYNMVITAASGQSLRQLVKREINTDGVTSSENKLMALQVSVLPNATHDIFTVETDAENISVRVFDRAMQLIDAPINNHLIGKHTIDLKNHENGVYFVHVSTKTATATEKIIKRGTLSDDEESSGKLMALQMSVSSNAAHDVFTVQTDAENVSVKVFDREMQLIDAPINSDLIGTHIIDLTNHEKGVYFVKVSTKTATATGRIIRRGTLSDEEEGSGKLMALQMSVSPNAAHDVFTVQTDAKNVSVKVYDREMQLIDAPINSDLIGTHIIDLTNHEKGVYFVKVSTKTATATERIIRRGTLSDDEEGSGKLMALQMSVSSNAAHDIFTVQTDAENVSVKVFDRKMQLIDAPVLGQLIGTHTVDLTSHESGLYFIQVSTKFATATERVIKRGTISDEEEGSGRLMELQVSVYPNPTSGVCTIDTPGGGVEIQVFDRTMQPIFAPVSNHLADSYTVDLTNFQSGVYFVQVRTKSAIATERIMKR